VEEEAGDIAAAAVAVAGDIAAVVAVGDKQTIN
jgi:hypothetical protein